MLGSERSAEGALALRVVMTARSPLEWIASLTSLTSLHNLAQLSKLSLFNSPALTQSEVDDFIAQTQVMPHEVCGVLDGSECASEPCPMF